MVPAAENCLKRGGEVPEPAKDISSGAGQTFLALRRSDANPGERCICAGEEVGSTHSNAFTDWKSTDCPSLYVDRIAGGDRDHRDSRGDASSGAGPR